MASTYVFIDTETTGLDPRQDVIIEVGAVVWRDGEVLEEYTTLVAPNRPIPPAITRLTGITDEMVANAPSLYTLRNQLRRLIGDHFVVGHNVGFDLGFLQAESLAVNNRHVDTLTLASILLPSLGRYSLNYLAAYLQLPQATYHRALDDARQTCRLFTNLQERARQIDEALLEEILDAGSAVLWDEAIFFQEILQQKARYTFTSGQGRGVRVARLFNPPPVDGPPLASPDDDVPPDEIDAESITAMLRPGSQFSRAWPDFEYRPQQEQMTRAVVQALNHQQHVMVEAGTGTGKSLAYLLPAAFWAQQNERRVVVSTNTINLQDQLIHKDIPALQALLPFELRAAVRKGKANYLCTRRFQQLRHRGPKSADEMTLYARLLLWLSRTDTGDVSAITLRTPGERQAWQHLNAETTNCRTNECAVERCPLHLARRRAEVAHIVIVNHALLLADVANANLVLPPFKDLIIDEAHHLEAAVTNGLSFEADKRFLDTLLDEINKPRAGLVGLLESQLNQLSPDAGERLNAIIARLRDEANHASFRVDEFFESVRFFLREYARDNSDFAQEVRLTSAVRAQPLFDEIILSWDNLNLSLGQLGRGLTGLAAGVSELAKAGLEIEGGEELQSTLVAYAADLEQTRLNLDRIIAQPSAEMIYWAELWRDRLALHAAPLHVGPLVEEYLFHRLDTIVMTSATLRTAPLGRYDQANFDYLRARLRADHAEELAVGSPFNYQQSTLLYLCTDMPEPNQPGYQRYVEQAIVDVAKTLGGRTLVLFTANRQLRDTAEAIQARLFEAGISVLAQAEGLSRQELLAQFATPASRSVLLGAKSFWEGVDVPGEPLQAVIVVKLPFDVPSDPVFSARSETFENSFYEYAIPEAVLRFRQGFGRLIRRQSDEGVVVVLDKRILSRRYGELFLNALPACTVVRQRTARLSELLERWQNRARSG